MAKHSTHLADDLDDENTGGFLAGLLADEDDFDRRMLWRLGSWGAAAVGAVIVAVLANQSSIGQRRDQMASSELARQARQAEQLQWVARESQDEARRLASAVDTLNGDRDRLYSRVTTLEQGLDTVTGSITRQNTASASPQAAAKSSSPPAPGPAASEPAAAAQNQTPPPVVAAPATTAAVTAEKPRAVAAAEPVPPSPPPSAQANPAPSEATPATPLMASKSIMAPPDSAAAKLIEPDAPASVVTAAPIPEVVGSLSSPDEATPDTSAKVAVQRTQFAVDVGSANSIGGLRALWRGLLKSKSNVALTTLRPIIVVKEGNNGLGMQLRLVAGPLGDAATAAKICAALIENRRSCETTLFDGQRLAMNTDDPPAAAKPVPRRRGGVKRPVAEDETPKKPETSTLSSLFSRR